MASEDSDQFLAGYSPVHRLGDLGDLDQPTGRQVASSGHQLDALSELLEVASLRRQQRVSTEERDHRLHQIVASVDDVLAQVLAVVVVPPVQNQAAHPEELLELLEAAHAADSLRHRKPVRDLVAGRVALPVVPSRLSNEAD